MKELLDAFRASKTLEINAELFTPGMRILNLAPHPDDFDVAAVTFRRMVTAECDIQLSVLTSGAAGVLDSYCQPPTWEKKSTTREGEQLKSCARFGLPPEQVDFLRIPEADDGELLEDEYTRMIFREQFRQYNPDVLVIPHGSDSNSGHRRTYRLVMEQINHLNHPVALFCCLDPKTLEIDPNGYTWFGDSEADWKRSLLRCHDSQQQRNLDTRGVGFDDRILTLNAESGNKYGSVAPYVEAFEVRIFNHG